MPRNRADLVDRLATTEQSGLDAALLIPLLRLLAAGEPVPVDDLAAATGRSPADVRSSLAAVPDTEYDATGRIVGQGLTLRPTTHRFTVGGHELSTWCALDTLMFPALLEQPARVASVSPVSGRPVRLEVGPERVTGVEPDTAVVSVVVPEDMSSIRSSFCNEVHFFTSPEDAAPWLPDHPGAEILPVADAFELALALVDGFTRAATADG